MDRNEVSTAFEIVLEEIEDVVDNLNQDGAGAFQKGDYETARNLVETATRLTDFRGKVRGLQKEWDTLFSTRVPRKALRRTRTSVQGKLRKGMRTPEEAFRRPLLETLMEAGGSASVNVVLDKLEGKMGAFLNEYDYQPLPSNPNTTRWRNNAQWCRNTLVQEGLMRHDSARGIWAISDRGRLALEKGSV